MADVVGTMPERSTRAHYPWSVWLDGQVWRLEQGADFQCSAKTLCVMAHTAARRLGVRVTTRRSPDGTVVHLQQVGSTEDSARGAAADRDLARAEVAALSGALDVAIGLLSDVGITCTVESLIEEAAGNG